MPIKRTYAELGDACATAHAMELISEHWAYIVIRELFLGDKRFGELLESARGITPAVLTKRLRELEERGIIESRMMRSPARVRTYGLSDWGLRLEPILQGLGQWAQDSPGLPQNGGLTPDAAILAMRTMAPDYGVDPPLELQLRLSDGRNDGRISYDYVATWDKGGFRVDRGELTDPPAFVDIDSSAWSEVLFNHVPLPADSVSGDREAVGRLLENFRPSVKSEEKSA